LLLHLPWDITKEINFIFENLINISVHGIKNDTGVSIHIGYYNYVKMEGHKVKSLPVSVSARSKA